MTLEEFANKKSLSVRAKNVLLYYSFKNYVEEKPMLKADIFDLFKHISPQDLISIPNCGKKTVDEIIKALEEIGAIHENT